MVPVTILGPKHESIYAERDELDERKKQFRNAAQAARNADDDDDASWFEWEYRIALERYEETCRSLKMLTD